MHYIGEKSEGAQLVSWVTACLLVTNRAQHPIGKQNVRRQTSSPNTSSHHPSELLADELDSSEVPDYDYVAVVEASLSWGQYRPSQRQAERCQ